MTLSKNVSLHNADPRIIELLRQAHQESFTFGFYTRGQAHTFTHKLNHTRQLMRAARHEYVPLIDRVVVRRPQQNPGATSWFVVVEPAGREYDELLNRFLPPTPGATPGPLSLPDANQELSLPEPSSPPLTTEDAIHKLFGKKGTPK